MSTIRLTETRLRQIIRQELLREKYGDIGSETAGREIGSRTAVMTQSPMTYIEDLKTIRAAILKQPKGGMGPKEIHLADVLTSLKPGAMCNPKTFNQHIINLKLSKPLNHDYTNLKKFETLSNFAPDVSTMKSLGYLTNPARLSPGEAARRAKQAHHEKNW